VAEALVYLSAIALFSFVIVGSALMRHEMLLLACFPPVFVALIMGFVMMLYAADAFGTPPTAAALGLGAVPAWVLARRLGSKDLLIVIYLGWAVALVLALVGVTYPDEVPVAEP
jgi:hypothetical protein